MIRIMPFRTASSESVAFDIPTIRIRAGEAATEPGDPIHTWDYLSEPVITSRFKIDAEHLLASTRLPSCDAVAAVLQIDCPTTGFRAITTMPAAAGMSEPATLALVIPANAVADVIEVRLGLVLAEAIPGDLSPNMHATQKGSRLYALSRTHRFDLTSSSHGFPTEAFDFGAVGYPAQAAWRLRVSPESLADPFMNAVRLYVNTSHPRAPELLAGKSEFLNSVLRYDALCKLLGCVVDADRDELVGPFDAGSLGAVLSELANLHLGMDLESTASAIQSDAGEISVLLQSSAGFLLGKMA